MFGHPVKRPSQFSRCACQEKKSKSEVNSGELTEFWDKDVKYSKKKTKYWEPKIKGPSTRTEPHNPAPSTLT